MVDNALAKIDKNSQEKFLKLLDATHLAPAHAIFQVEDHRKWRKRYQRLMDSDLGDAFHPATG